MKITIKQIFDARDILIKLGGFKMDISTAYRIQKNISLLNKELENFSKTVQEISGDKNTKEENFAKLLEEELEVDISQIEIDKLGNIEISPFELAKIEWMIL